MNGQAFFTRDGVQLVDAHGVAGPHDRGKIPGFVQALGQDGQVRLPVCQHGIDFLPAPVSHDGCVQALRSWVMQCLTVLQDCSSSKAGRTRIRLFRRKTSGSPPASREASMVAQEAAT